MSVVLVVVGMHVLESSQHLREDLVLDLRGQRVGLDQICDGLASDELLDGVLEVLLVTPSVHLGDEFGARLTTGGEILLVRGSSEDLVLRPGHLLDSNDVVIGTTGHDLTILASDTSLVDLTVETVADLSHDGDIVSATITEGLKRTETVSTGDWRPGEVIVFGCIASNELSADVACEHDPRSECL
jgi:hypothetical protein